MSVSKGSLFPLVIRCLICNEAHDLRSFLSNCTRCRMLLRAEYDFRAIRVKLTDLAERPASLGRSNGFMPLQIGDEISLGKGFTPLGSFLCRRAFREGFAVTESEEESSDGATTLARQTGIDACPEGGAARTA